MRLPWRYYRRAHVHRWSDSLLFWRQSALETGYELDERREFSVHILFCDLEVWVRKAASSCVRRSHATETSVRAALFPRRKCFRIEGGTRLYAVASCSSCRCGLLREPQRRRRASRWLSRRFHPRAMCGIHRADKRCLLLAVGNTVRFSPPWPLCPPRLPFTSFLGPWKCRQFLYSSKVKIALFLEHACRQISCRCRHCHSRQIRYRDKRESKKDGGRSAQQSQTDRCEAYVCWRKGWVVSRTTERRSKIGRV